MTTRSVETVVTYLEMRERPSVQRLHVPPPANIKVALMLAEQPTLHFYRYLYNAVGHSYAWVDRRFLNDEELAALVLADGIEIWVAYAAGVPAGYFELDARKPGEVWLQYFGIVPEFQGRGLGKWLICEAISAAWNRKPDRFCVETCTLDHPAALPLYQRCGFAPFDRKVKLMEIPA